MLKAFAPDGHERLPIAVIGGAQCCKIALGGWPLVRRGVDIGQVEATRQPIHEYTGEATVEIGEGVDAEQAAFGKGQGFEPAVVRRWWQMIEAGG